MLFASFRRHAATLADRQGLDRIRAGRSQLTGHRLGLEPLEDRTLPSSGFGFGWAFNVGSPGYRDGGYRITIDTSGNLYVTGWFGSPTLNFDPNNTNPSNPNHTPTNNTNSPAQFVAKYTSNQTFQWVTTLGASLDTSDTGGIAVDGAGNVYVAYIDASSNRNTRVAKLDAGSGTVAWNVLFSGNSASSNAGVAVGPSGDVYVTGSNSSSQAFVAKLDALGNVLWNQQPSDNSAAGLAVAVDSSEHVYVAYVDGTSIKVAKFDPASGNTISATSVGSNGGHGAGIAVDSTGNIYMAGGASPFYVAKLAPANNGSLNQVWNDNFSGKDWASGVAVDSLGSVYTTGSFTGSVDFHPGTGRFALQSTGDKNQYDVFVSKLDTNGNFVAAADIVSSVPKVYPSNAGSDGNAIALDNSSPGSPNVYTTGWFRSTSDFDPTSNTYDLTPVGGSGPMNLFISKLTQSSPGGGAATPSSPDTGKERSLKFGSNLLSLASIVRSIDSIRPTRGEVALQLTVGTLVLGFSQALIVLKPGTDDSLTALSRPLRQESWLERFFAKFDDRLLEYWLSRDMAYAFAYTNP